MSSLIHTLRTPHIHLPSPLLLSRPPHLLTHREPPPFFDQTRDSRSPVRYGQEREQDPKGKRPMREGEEVEVDDREWEIRVGSAILHLRTTLPHFFNPSPDTPLYPPSIYSESIKLHLPDPLPLALSSLPVYQTTFALARNGMKALHTNLHVTLDRLTVSTPPPPTDPQTFLTTRRSSKSTTSVGRNRQVRVVLSVYGTPRLPPHEETHWRLSSLYTLSPLSGLISSHHVETIRPLPGRGVGEWLNDRLGLGLGLGGWGWRAGEAEGMLGRVGVGARSSSDRMEIRRERKE